MIVVVCPTTDSVPHDLWSTACDCGCRVQFVENGNMMIVHEAFDESKVESWGVFEGETLDTDD